MNESIECKKVNQVSVLGIGKLQMSTRNVKFRYMKQFSQNMGFVGCLGTQNTIHLPKGARDELYQDPMETITKISVTDTLQVQVSFHSNKNMNWFMIF